MLTSLFAALKEEYAIANSKEILWNLYAIVHLLETQWCKDQNLRDAAIDTLIAFLEQHKSKTTIQPVQDHTAIEGLCAPAIFG